MYRTLGVAVVVFLSTAALASPQTIRKGERYQLYNAGVWRTAVVTNVTDTDVQVQIAGVRDPLTVAPNDLRPIVKNAPRGRPETGKRVEYFNGSEWKVGTITAIAPGSMKVQPDGLVDEDAVIGKAYRLVPEDYGAVQPAHEASASNDSGEQTPLNSRPQPMGAHETGRRSDRTGRGRSAPAVVEDPHSFESLDMQTRSLFRELPQPRSMSATQDARSTDAGDTEAAGAESDQTAAAESAEAPANVPGVLERPTESMGNLTKAELNLQSLEQSDFELKSVGATPSSVPLRIRVVAKGDAAVVMYRHGQRSYWHSIEIVNLHNGRSELFHVPDGCLPVDVSPDGERLLVALTDASGQSKGAMALISLRLRHPGVLKQWSIAGRRINGAAGDRFAPVGYAGNDHVVLTDGNTWALQYVTTRDIVHWQKGPISVTEDGALLAIAKDQWLTIYTTYDLSPIAHWPLRGMPAAAVAISPDRTRVLVAAVPTDRNASPKAVMLDGETGKELRRLSTPIPAPTWLVDARFALTGDGRLLDTEHDLTGWTYDVAPESCLTPWCGRAWLVGARQGAETAALLVADVPDPTVRDAVDNAMKSAPTQAPATGFGKSSLAP